MFQMENEPVIDSTKNSVDSQNGFDPQNKILNAVIKPRRRTSTTSEDLNDTPTNTNTSISSSSDDEEYDSVVSNEASSSSKFQVDENTTAVLQRTESNSSFEKIKRLQKRKDSVEKLRDIEAMEERKLNEERIRILSKPILSNSEDEIVIAKTPISEDSTVPQIKESEEEIPVTKKISNIDGKIIPSKIPTENPSTGSEISQMSQGSETSSSINNNKEPEGEEKSKTIEPTENIPLDILLALRTCVIGGKQQRVNKIDDELTPKDYDTGLSYKISRGGAQKRFAVKDFSPKVFFLIRQSFNIHTESYLKSWVSITPPEKSAGKSNSHFIFSSDKKYLLKTISKNESKYLRHILPSYFLHLGLNPNTLLMRYLGHHRVTIAGKRIYFVVLNNVLESPLPMDEIYDLKGSKVGRSASEIERKKTSPIFKDNDFIQSEKLISLPFEIREQIINQINLDVKWLEQSDIMDYSLLIGIQRTKHDLTKSVDDMKNKTLKKLRSRVYFCEDVKTIKTRSATLRPSRSRSQAMLDRRGTESERKDSISNTAGIHSYDGNEVYFIGIIDILQRYNNKKRLANLAKSLRHAKDELSTVEPKLYASRFKEFVSKALPANPVTPRKEPLEGELELKDLEVKEEDIIKSQTSSSHVVK